MECLLGITGKNFVTLAADTGAMQSIIVVKDDTNKINQLGQRLAMAVVGEGGDPVQFAEYISKNIKLYELRNGYQLSTAATANFTRKQLADLLRTRDAYMVNSLIAGYDPEVGASLYFLDYLGTLEKIPYGGHGYGGTYFATGVFDKYYHPDVSQEEARDILKAVYTELQKRFVINLPRFSVFTITEDGMTREEDIAA